MSIELLNQLKERCSKNETSIEHFTLDRKIERVSRVKPSILGYSHKGLLMSYLESNVEFNVAVSLEYDPSVNAYMTQPASFYIKVDGKVVRHTPDFLVEFSDGALVFLQVKPSKKAYSAAYQSKFEQYKNYFMDTINIPYVLVTEEDIGCRKTIVNRQKLFHFLGLKINPDVKNAILECMPKKFTISQLEETCQQEGQSDTFAWGLIAQGHVAYDSTELLTRKSLVSLA